MTPLDGDARPMPKSIQLASRSKKHGRPAASPSKWAGLHEARQGPCILLDCGASPPNDLHHVIPRDRGGRDVEENLVPLCRRHHQLLEMRDRLVCLLFVESLWHMSQEPGPRGGLKDTYSWAVDTFGEDVWETIYHIQYRRPS